MKEKECTADSGMSEQMMVSFTKVNGNRRRISCEWEGSEFDVGHVS